MIHGGLRYLAQGRIGLVHEALAERARLLANAPHLVHPLRFVVPAAGSLELKPGAHHVMLIDLRKPLKDGDSVQLTLTLQQGSATRDVMLAVPVRSVAGATMKH